MSTPDFIEPFVGWKGLCADEAGNLWSPSLETLWPAGERLVATCTHKRHTPPGDHCSCGIYALNTFEDLREHRYNWGEAAEGRIRVAAEVKLWGRLRPGRIGYRAQFAYPQKVYIPAHKLLLVAPIRERYGVPIGVIDRFTGKEDVSMDIEEEKETETIVIEPVEDPVKRPRPEPAPERVPERTPVPEKVRAKVGR